jgi:hypothetical protein
MKHTMIFNLPEDSSDFELANNGPKFYSVIWELEAYLRNKLKYENAGKETEEIRSYLHSLLSAQNIDLNL